MRRTLARTLVAWAVCTAVVGARAQDSSSSGGGAQPATEPIPVPGPAAVARAHHLYQSGQKHQARAILLEQMKAGHWEIDWFQQKKRGPWFSDVDAAEQLVGAIEELPRQERYLEEGQFWLGDVCRMLEYGYGDRSPADELRFRELILRAYRTADDFSRVEGALERDELGRSRPYLDDLSRALIREGRYEEAYELLRRAALGGPGAALPEADLATLFLAYGWDDSAPYYPATLLVWLAQQTGRLSELRGAVGQRRRADRAWDAIGLRLLALIDVERGDDEAAGAALEEIAHGPTPRTPRGVDVSLDVLAEAAARRPTLAASARALLARLLETMSARVGVDSQAVGYIFDLARLHLIAGDKAKAEETLARAARRGRSRGVDAELEHAVVLAETAALYHDCGYLREALAAYRELLKRPFVPQSKVTTFGLANRSPRVATDETRRILERLSDESQLEDLVAQARAEWDKRKDAPPGERDCEPLVFVAACEMLRGEYAAASDTLAELAEQDYPASLMLVVECLAASPDPSQGLPTIDRMLVRWPYLFRSEASDCAALYVRASCPLPVGSWLGVYIDSLSGATGLGATDEERPDAAMRQREERDLRVPPAAAAQREHIGEVLRSMEDIYFRYRGADEHYAALVKLLARYLGCNDFAYRWLAWLVEHDPAQAYATAAEFLGLGPPADPTHPLARLTLASVFDAQREPTWLAFDPYRSGDCEKPPKTIALAVVEAARRSGKLTEFVAACEQAVQTAAAAEATAADRGRAELAARLQLQALTLENPARVRESVPPFLAGSDRFALAPAPETATAADPAFTAIREACWRVPELRSEALQVGAKQIELEWGRVELERDRTSGAASWPSQDLIYRVAEMRLALGQTAPGIDGVRVLLRHLTDRLEERVYLDRGSLTLARPQRLVALARRYDVQAEALELLHEYREWVAGHPRMTRQIELAEQELREDLGQEVVPGIVLAVQPTGAGRLEFIWQVNRETLPTPPEALVGEAWTALRAPVRRALHVVFASPERALPAEGFEVRLEQSDDGRSFEALRAASAADGGAYILECAVEPNVLRWYRAQLLRARQVIATSVSVAAIAGENLLPMGCFRDATATAWRAPEGWRYRCGDGGRVEIVSQTRPGCADFRALCSVFRRQESIVHSVRNVPIDAGAAYVLSGWAIATPGRRCTHDADVAEEPEVALGLRGLLWLSLRDDRDTHLAWKNLAFDHAGDVAFAQVVLLPADAFPVRAAASWLNGFERDADTQGIVLSERARAIEFWLRPSRETGLGDFWLSTAGGYSGNNGSTSAPNHQARD